MQLNVFRENELMLQDALGQTDLSYTLLVEVLLKPILPTEMLVQLRNLEDIFKSRSLPEIEGIASLLIQQIESGQLDIQLELRPPLPSKQALIWLEIWPEAMAQFRIKHDG